MQKNEAIQCVRRWLNETGKHVPGYAGAYLSGSILEASDNAPWPQDSDIDVVVLISANQIPPSCKFHAYGALIESTYLDTSALADTEQMLNIHYLSYAMYHGAILDDPSGILRPLHAFALEEYPKPHRVRSRFNGMLQGIQSDIDGFQPNQPLETAAMGWLFCTGKTTFPVLIAALKNCTVRKRYTALRSALEALNMPVYTQTMFAPLLGASFSPSTLPRSLAALTLAFNDACLSTGASSGYRFRSDISAGSRDISITWIENTIASAHPEDCVFWLGATFSRCLTVLHMDNSPKYSAHLQAFKQFLSTLGISSLGDLAARISQLSDFLPTVEKIAECALTAATQRQSATS